MTPPTPDSYLVPARTFQAESKVLGSRFLAFVFPVETREDALARWKELQTAYFDATHHCYAFRLGVDGADTRAHDDGEPGGTAGKPILGAIEHRGLTNALVVVVRYFGGTKLGVGGLVRAYGDAAAQALDGAGTRECFALVRIGVAFGHDLTQPVMRAIHACDARIAETDYDSDAHLVLEVRAREAGRLRAMLTELSRGAVRFES